MPPAPLQPLDDRGVLLLEGADAVAFLQGQVTADITHLAPARAMLAALCTAQGRVMAVAWVGRTARGLALVLPREHVAPLADRLARFVLRARVTIRDASEELRVGGLCGSGDAWPTLPGGWDPLQLPHGRMLAVGPAAAAPATGGAAASWDALGVALGEPEVYAATREAWVPQMLNLDLLGAVSFTKGCYTGQEVVARVQYLGQSKRRMFRYRFVGTGLRAGSPLFREGAEVGKVVRLAGGPQQGELLAVVATASAGLELGAAEGQATCAPLPLPYAVPGVAQPA